MEFLRICKDDIIVTIHQTIGGGYCSVPTKDEVLYFYRKSLPRREVYLQKEFYSNGFGEGAKNLLEIVKHLDAGYDFSSLCILVQEV